MRERIQIQEYQAKWHQTTLIIPSILTKSYHPIFLPALHAKLETVHHKAPTTEKSTASFKRCIMLHQNLSRFLVTMQLVYIRFAHGCVKAVHLIMSA